ncbi:unnamed protein product [Penicillium camemberti]|uniref:Str. FM013 n=1 Tax=Penicillium camemberti (strain FM 013) TaxID=1429867 RepID=A0A0G4P7S6_PENC3|nr:unnamed protein product [Penicillium camemberti]
MKNRLNRHRDVAEPVHFKIETGRIPVHMIDTTASIDAEHAMYMEDSRGPREIAEQSTCFQHTPYTQYRIAPVSVWYGVPRV